MDFRAIKVPFSFNRGIEYSSKCFNGATALDVTISYFSLLFLQYSSALVFITFILFNFNVSITYFKKLHFFSVASIKSIVISGKTIFSTNPGNPAPDPISQIYWFFKSILFTIVNES